MQKFLFNNRFLTLTKMVEVIQSHGWKVSHAETKLRGNHLKIDHIIPPITTICAVPNYPFENHLKALHDVYDVYGKTCAHIGYAGRA